MRSGSATDVPPNFWTTRATGGQVIEGSGASRHRYRGPIACAVMAKRSNPRNRERQAGRDAAARRAVERTERRRRLIAIVAVVVVLMAVVGTIVAAANDKGGEASTQPSTTTTTGLGDGPTTEPPGPTVSVEPPAAGAQISGPTPCPAEDGSSARTTLFAEAPPTCIDPAQTYDAVISTSVGDLKVFLNTQLAPRAVNNFVVLARYHYYDGAPFVLITPQKTAQVGSDFPMPDGQR